MHYEKRSKLKKRLPARVKNPLVIPSEPNTTWSIDFVSDRLHSVSTFRVLNIIDDCNMVAVGQECIVEFKNLKHKDKNGTVVGDIKDGWSPGYEYTYIISIGLNGEIQFEPIVSEWTPILADPEIGL